MESMEYACIGVKENELILARKIYLLIYSNEVECIKNTNVSGIDNKRTFREGEN